MNQEITFRYDYSAKENIEVHEIRKKYLPQCESKLEELKRLDRIVQNSGMIESLCVGIGGLLIFGFGLCLVMQVIGTGVLIAIVGILLGVVSMACMFAAYPVYHSIFKKTKTKYTQRILELANELSGNETTML